jgi:hypothetical protein
MKLKKKINEKTSTVKKNRYQLKLTFQTLDPSNQNHRIGKNTKLNSKLTTW